MAKAEKGSNSSYGEKVKNRKKTKKHVPVGIAHIESTPNNTRVTISDPDGNVLLWESAGKDFRGSKKTTTYAATRIAMKAMTNARDNFGMEKIAIQLKGVGSGREHAARAMKDLLKVGVESVKDVTGIPHNGCRLPKERKV